MFDRIVRDWGGVDQSLNLAKRAKPLLSRWQKILDQERKELLESKERATFGLHSGDLSADLERSFYVALNHIDKRLREIQELEGRIVSLREDPGFVASMSRFGNGVFERLSEVERRTFLMAVVDSIKVSFGETIRIGMEYRLSPYAALASEIGQITETGDDTMGEKPKAQ